MNHVVVTTAVKLSAEQKAAVKEVAAQRLGSAKFELTETVDPSILGGVRLAINSQVYDASVSGKFTALRALT